MRAWRSFQPTREVPEARMGAAILGMGCCTYRGHGYGRQRAGTVVCVQSLAEMVAA